MAAVEPSQLLPTPEGPMQTTLVASAPAKVSQYYPNRSAALGSDVLQLVSGKVFNLSEAHLTLSKDEDVTMEIFTACLQRIRQLEAQVSTATVEIDSWKRKRSEAATSTNASKQQKLDVASGTSVSKKQVDMILKKVVTGAKQSLKGVKFFPGWDSTAREAKVSDLVSKAEFETVFKGGKLIQPTPENKPKSQVTIKEYTGEAIVELLGASAKNLKGELWQKGGAPTRGFGFFGGGGGFSKGKKLGSVPLDITVMKVTYSNASQQLSIALSVTNSSGGGSCGYDSDDF
ncbi:hypothetical protein CYMTET_53937 [Cymbomonas tetramitiformis]|uniref:Uncharacterized protein n=1 Tax=Cymbomonas tetramitiformis TaxID=36881 RepID=A0AAE0BHT5_9CHLO|nr:hypothetical protein CYMTET_53937 [Cymbomonas tetramitiformis]